MRVGERAYRSIWLAADRRAVEIIDQTRLPFRFEIVRLESAAAAMDAIRRMLVRGAPLIGATAAYGLCLGLREDVRDAHLERLATELIDCRPTAVNLRWAVERMLARLGPLPPDRRLAAAYREAALICDEDVAVNEAIGTHGLGLIEALHRRKTRSRCASSPIATPAGWPRWIGARHWRRYTRRRRPVSRCTFGWTRPGRATRARASPPGNWPRPGYPTS